jgi:thiamine biosynthesis protein ThiS
MKLTINGQNKDFAHFAPGTALSTLLEHLQLRADRIAVEQNGSIVARSAWPETSVNDGDKLEIVQFVGGGSGHPAPAFRMAH